MLSIIERSNVLKICVMEITYTEEKKFTQDEVQRLFLSVGWVPGLSRPRDRRHHDRNGEREVQELSLYRDHAGGEQKRFFLREVWLPDHARWGCDAVL